MTKLTGYEEELVDAVCVRGGSTVLGQSVTFTALPPTLMLKARKRVAAAGREAMEPFYDWLIEFTGVSDSTAKTYTTFVWNSLVVTGGDPTKQLERIDLAYSTKNTLKAALKRWATFNGDAKLANYLASHNVTRLIRDRKRSKPAKIIRPFSRAEIDALLGAINEHRDDPRHPWAWPVLRIIVKLGLRARTDACWIEKEQVLDAVKGSGALRIWSKREKMRVVPARGIAEELEVLAHWPFEWEVVADIVAPDASPKKRATAAYDKIRAKLKYYAEMVGIDPKTVRTHRLRHSAALRLYEETGHNLIAVMHLLGHTSVETTKNYLNTTDIAEMDSAIMSAYSEEDEDDEYANDE